MELRDLAAMSVGREYISPCEGLRLIKALDSLARLADRYEDEELAQLPQENNPQG
jgi:hypothetical protein